MFAADGGGFVDEIKNLLILYGNDDLIILFKSNLVYNSL